jgi:hypothetical protein
MGVSESVLDRILVISAIDDEIPGGPTLCRIRANRDDSASVRVEQSQYMTGTILPLLDELREGGSVGWIIDPLDKFVEFDRNLTYVGRAVADRWLDPLCRSRPGLTPWLNDHPSKAGMKDGFGYGGSPGLVNAIPSFLALRKKLGSDHKPIIQEYPGTRQVSLELEIVRVKEARDDVFSLYRIGDSPLLSLKPADGLTLVAAMVRVYEAVERHRAKGEWVRHDNTSSRAIGLRSIAEELMADEKLVKDAMRTLCQIGVYTHQAADTSSGKTRRPGGLVPGGNNSLTEITGPVLYAEIRRQGITIKADGDVAWTRVEVEGAEYASAVTKADEW